MGELIVRDDGQLRRLQSTIAAIESRSACDQIRMLSLLDALYAEREELQRARRPVRRAA